jgi:F0F1-type ATP synthase assembly protein I
MPQQAPHSDPEETLKQKRKRYNAVLKYSGLAFQMIAVLLLCTFLGYKLDQYLQLKIPVFMILFIIAGLFAYLYKLMKDLK